MMARKKNYREIFIYHRGPSLKHSFQDSKTITTNKQTIKKTTAILLIGGNHITSFISTVTAYAQTRAQYLQITSVRSEAEHGYRCKIASSPFSTQPLIIPDSLLILILQPGNVEHQYSASVNFSVISLLKLTSILMFFFL